MKNKAIIIGMIGLKRCYINLSKEEAIERYKITEDLCLVDEEVLDDIEEIEFDDEFGVYDAWQ
jgi:tetrahydromethanopterin S-methyltransferase subunit A